MSGPRHVGDIGESGRSSTYVHAPSAEIDAWRRAAKREGRTLNGWLRQVATAMAKRPID